MENKSFKCHNLSAEDVCLFLKKTDFSNIIVLETVDSTNTFAKALAVNGAKNNTVVIANHQTAGRGRLGRDFFSPSDTGLYMSIILRPENPCFDPSSVTISAGVAVCQAIEKVCGKKPQIKWVNDIFLEGRKICGILAEAGTNSGALNYIIVGIGLNISTKIFPGELHKIAGSLGAAINRNLLAAEIIQHFDDAQKLCGTDKLITEYKKRSLVLGKKIDFIQDGKVYTGIATDINNEGNLVVALEDGNNISLKSGEVSLRSESFVNS